MRRAQLFGQHSLTSCCSCQSRLWAIQHEHVDASCCFFVSWHTSETKIQRFITEKKTQFESSVASCCFTSFLCGMYFTVFLRLFRNHLYFGMETCFCRIQFLIINSLFKRLSLFNITRLDGNQWSISLTSENWGPLPIFWRGGHCSSCYSLSSILLDFCPLWCPIWVCFLAPSPPPMFYLAPTAIISGQVERMHNTYANEIQCNI